MNDESTVYDFVTKLLRDTRYGIEQGYNLKVGEL